MLTVNNPQPDVADGVQVPLTTHLYAYPFMPGVVGLMLNVAVVTPVYGAAFEMLENAPAQPVVLTCH